MWWTVIFIDYLNMILIKLTDSVGIFHLILHNIIFDHKCLSSTFKTLKILTGLSSEVTIRHVNNRVRYIVVKNIGIDIDMVI